MQHRSTAPRFLALALVATATAAAVRAHAQTSTATTRTVSTRPAPNATAAPTDPTGKKILTLADYGRWKRITSTALSADGKWITYAYQPNEGDATLYVKQFDGDKMYTIPIGSAPAGGRGGGGGGDGGTGGGGGPAFSDDGKFVGYYVNPPAPPTGGRGRGAPGGGGGRGQAPFVAVGATTPRPPARRFELLDLATGAKFPVPNAATFRFAKGGKWLAVRVNRPAGDTTRQGGDLVLRELATAVTRNIGNVNLYDFDDAGRFLAYTVDAGDRIGNGVYLVDLATGGTRPLNTATLDFDQLIWSDAGTNLAVLRGEKVRDTRPQSRPDPRQQPDSTRPDSTAPPRRTTESTPARRQKDNVLLAWMDLGAPKPRSLEYDPAKDEGFPRDMVLSEFSPPRWSKDGSRIFVGIKEQEPELPRTDEPQANVDVWHWKDPEPQSQQVVRLQQERRSTYPAAILVATNRFVRFGDNEMRGVQPTANGKWGIGRFDAPYRGEVAWGGSRADVYRVNTATGERTLVEKGLTRTMGTSPDSRYFLYLKDKHVFAYNLETGKKSDLDEGEKISWLDMEDDHPYEIPTYGVAGWSKDGRSVLLNHKYDIWQMPLDGGKAINLTGGVGEAQKIRFRLVRLDRAGGGGGRGGGGRGGFGGGGDDEDTGVDLTRPLTLSAYGDLTKKSGYWQVTPGRAPTPLIYADKQIGAAQKAEKADRVIFTEQTFNEFPDLWTSTTAFAAPKKLTDANPQLSEYAWAKGKVLVDYTNSKGQKLQGTLTLPANYEPGKKYPMLVYFYEIMSNTHHNFSAPAFDDRPQNSTYTSDGYLYFQPDVVYETGKPGSSALDCVTSAVKKVIELGYADPAHIGLQGHSWGGYQSSFIVTQTDMFAAVVTGAPPTNLVSFYGETYPGTGTLQQGIIEVGQVRMGTNPWESHDLFENQSPIFHVRNIKTPFMILHGTADNAVDWHQGLEFYGAARRWGKQVIFLSYPDEPHHLSRRENQKDFQIRMKQYFDHYLKGTPEPKWMKEGVPQTRKGMPIE